MMQAFFLCRCRRVKYDKSHITCFCRDATRKTWCSQVIFGNGLPTHKNGLCASHLRKAFLARLAASRRRPVARGGVRLGARPDAMAVIRAAVRSHWGAPHRAQPAAAPMASRCGAAALRRRFTTRDCRWESNGRIFQTGHCFLQLSLFCV